MRRKLNIKIEEVQFDKKHQITGMFGGPCGGASGSSQEASACSNRSDNNSYGANGLDRSVACGGCHGITSEFGRDVNKAVGTTARDTAVGIVSGGFLGGLGAGITGAVISTENISRNSYKTDSPLSSNSSKGLGGYVRSDGLH